MANLSRHGPLCIAMQPFTSGDGFGQTGNPISCSSPERGQRLTIATMRLIMDTLWETFTELWVTSPFFDGKINYVHCHFP